LKISAIVDKEMELLLKMAGVKNYSYEDFDKIIKDKDIALLIISDDFAELLKEKIIMHRLYGELPFIIEIPGKKKIEREDSIKRIITRAIGLEV